MGGKHAGKNISRRYFEIFSFFLIFPRKKKVLTFHANFHLRNLFSGINSKSIIELSSVELDQGVETVKGSLVYFTFIRMEPQPSVKLKKQTLSYNNPF